MALPRPFHALVFALVVVVDFVSAEVFFLVVFFVDVTTLAVGLFVVSFVIGFILVATLDLATAFRHSGGVCGCANPSSSCGRLGCPRHRGGGCGTKQ